MEIPEQRWKMMRRGDFGKELKKKLNDRRCGYISNPAYLPEIYYSSQLEQLVYQEGDAAMPISHLSAGCAKFPSGNDRETKRNQRIEMIRSVSEIKSSQEWREIKEGILTQFGIY